MNNTNLIVVTDTEPLEMSEADELRTLVQFGMSESQAQAMLEQRRTGLGDVVILTPTGEVLPYDEMSLQAAPDSAFPASVIGAPPAPEPLAAK